MGKWVKWRWQMKTTLSVVSILQYVQRSKNDVSMNYNVSIIQCYLNLKIHRQNIIKDTIKWQKWAFCLIPHLRGIAFRNFLLLSVMLIVDLFFITSVMLKYIPSTPILLSFYVNEFWILSNAFSVSVEMIKWLLSFIY